MDKSSRDLSNTINTFTGNLTNLSELQDVNIPSPTDTQALTYDSASKKWISTTISGITDTNETIRVNALTNTDCPSGQLVIGVQDNGTVLCATDSGTTFTNGSGISIVGTEINHSDTSSQADVDNSGNNFIQDILLDQFGHITSIVSTAVDFSSYFTSSQILGFNYYNNTNFPYNSLSNFTNDQGFYNSTTLENVSQLTNDANYLTSTSGLYNSTNFSSDFAGKTTDDLTEGSTNLYDNQSWNQTLADTLYADISVTGDNSSWNQSLADTLYIAQSNEGNLNVNSSNYWDNLNTPADILGSLINNDLGWITSSVTSLTNFFNKTDILGFNYYNSTSLENVSQLTNDAGYLTTTGNPFDQSLNTTENVTFKNVTADFFFGDGSQLTGITTTETDPLAYNGTLAYNSSLSNYYLNSNPSSFYNSTSLQNLSQLSDDLGNRGYTDLVNFTNSPGYITSYTETDPLWTGNQTNYYNKTDVNALPVSTFTNDAGYITSSTDTHLSADADFYLYNDSTNINLNGTRLNNTIDARDSDTTYSNNLNFTNGANYWNDTFATFNKTYADTLYADISVTGDNSSWNQSFADTLYYGIANPFGFYNLTDFDINNYYLKSNPFSFYNSTSLQNLSQLSDDLGNRGYTDLINFSNSPGYITTDTDTHLSADADKYLNNDSTTISFNETELNNTIDLRAIPDNSSWNESHANTLYIAQSNEGNLNVNSSTWWAGINSVGSILGSAINNDLGWITSSVSVLTNFYNKTDVDGFSLSKWTDDLGNRGYTNNLNFTNGAGYYNLTDFDINNYYLKSNPFNFWNDTFATFNKTYADTLYDPLGGGGGISPINVSLGGVHVGNGTTMDYDSRFSITCDGTGANCTISPGSEFTMVGAINKTDLPAETAFKDESNNFTVSQTFNDNLVVYGQIIIVGSTTNSTFTNNGTHTFWD